MERNLKSVNFRSPSPIRSWRKSAGPGEITLIVAAKPSINGPQTGAVAAINVKSKARFQRGTNSGCTRNERGDETFRRPARPRDDNDTAPKVFTIYKLRTAASLAPCRWHGTSGNQPS